MDPDYAARRLEELEGLAHSREEQYTQLAVSTARARDAQFERDPDHWVDQNCTVEANEWGFTNEWVRGELDPHLKRAQALGSVNPNIVRRAVLGERGRDPADRRSLMIGGPTVATETAGSEPAVGGHIGYGDGNGDGIPYHPVGHARKQRRAEARR